MHLHGIILETIKVPQRAQKLSDDWVRKASPTLFASGDRGHQGFCLVVERDVFRNLITDKIGILGSCIPHGADQLQEFMHI